MAAASIAQLDFAEMRGRHLLIALSGGADSVALAVLLKDAAEDCALTLSAAHLNHGIRGADADADEFFCRALCERLGIPLISKRIDVPALARQCGEGLETAAREVRHAFLEAARQNCGADYIALAHHLNDQAETVLMHLLRGAGMDGAGGMARLSGRLYRPLLGIRKRELTEYLRARGLTWREDQTNAEADTPRNALRLNVLPAIEECYPSAAEAIARFAGYARIENDYMNAQARRYLASNREFGAYGCRLRLKSMPHEAILRRAIREITGSALCGAKLDELIALCARPRGKTDISRALIAEKTPDALYFLQRDAQKIAPTALNLCGWTVLEGICRILTAPDTGEIARDNPNDELLDADALHGAELRTRRGGDRFHPLGAPGDRLLSDYLTDRRIDRPLRDFLPLVAVGSRILWVCGMGIAEEAKITPNTRRTLRLKLYPITDEKTGG